MDENKIEFIINRDPSNQKVELEGMSVETATAFSVILNSMINIIQLNPDHHGVKIQIKSGSAVLIAEGPAEQIEQIQDNFNDIINFKSVDKKLVNEWRSLQTLFKENGFDYEANFHTKGKKSPILSYLKGTRKLRARPVSVSLNSAIKFMTGKLVAVGGTNPNIHLEDKDGKRFTISCTETSALKANQFLYKKILISTWVRSGKEDEKYELCDSYRHEDSFHFLNSFITAFTAAGDEIKQLKMLHYQCRDFLDNKDYGGFRRFLRLFNHETTDVNILKTILIVTQSFKTHENLKDVRLEIKDVFDKKMKDYRRTKAKNS